MLYFRCEKLCPLGRTFFCIFGAKNYGGKRLLPLRQWGGGGVPFCLLSIYQAGFHSPLLPESPALQKSIESGQNRSKVNIYLLDFVSPREFRRPKGTKSKHIFGKWCWCVVSCAPLVVVFHGVHWCRCAGFLSVLYWLVSSGGALYAFCPLYCIALCRVACKYGSISRFKGVFSGFWGADVCLYGLRSLR